MPRYLARLQYLGTRYAGWQYQINGTGIQQVVTEAIRRFSGEDARVEASGRTDSGVHADAQWVHFDLSREIPEAGVVSAVNAELPPDVRVMEVRLVDPAFHARYNARGKTYVYRIWNAPVADVFQQETHAWVAAPLDLPRMRQAAALLEGHHDFRAFSVAEPEVSSTRRTVHEIAIEGDGPSVRITVRGNGFLRYMVRRIAGLLIEIGKGRLEPDYASRCLDPEYAPARWTAPPNGLTLTHVNYAEGTGSPDSVC